MKIRHFLLFVICFVVLLGSGCSPESGGGGYFAYRDRPFRAEVRGKLFGVSFCAELVRETTASGRVDRIRYLSPDAMSGVTLTVADGKPVQAQIDGAYVELAEERLAGWLLPLNALLRSDTGISAVQKGDGEVLLTLESGDRLTLGADGTPIRFSSADADFFVVWREG